VQGSSGALSLSESDVFDENSRLAMRIVHNFRVEDRCHSPSVVSLSHKSGAMQASPLDVALQILHDVLRPMAGIVTCTTHAMAVHRSFRRAKAPSSSEHHPTNNNSVNTLSDAPSGN
jgi:hypothetical protein